MKKNLNVSTINKDTYLYQFNKWRWHLTDDELMISVHWPLILCVLSLFRITTVYCAREVLSRFFPGSQLLFNEWSSGPGMLNSSYTLSQSILPYLITWPAILSYLITTHINLPLIRYISNALNFVTLKNSAFSCLLDYCNHTYIYTRLLIFCCCCRQCHKV